MKIVNLKHHTKFIPTLAEWHHNQWGYLNPGGSAEKRIISLTDQAKSDDIPQTFVAVSTGAVLGSASLVPHDMDTRMELSPWLASVYVAGNRRKQGIGSKLVRHVVKEAGIRGHKVLYLYTMPKEEEFYLRLGWSLFERTEHHGYKVAIMTIDTATV